MISSVIGYWFAANPRLPHGDGRAVVIGETLAVVPPIELCRHGLHGSEHPLDACRYSGGSLLYRCRYSGEILRDTDKLCATERTALAMVDLAPQLRLFARQQALSVIHLWDAPAVVREYLETGNVAIRDAAEDAAWTTWVTTWVTTRDARDARDAAKDAIWASRDARHSWVVVATVEAAGAVRDAEDARSAARVAEAAGSTVRAAAWAARDATWAVRDDFMRLVEKAFEEEIAS